MKICPKTLNVETKLATQTCYKDTRIKLLFQNYASQSHFYESENVEPKPQVLATLNYGFSPDFKNLNLKLC